MTTSTATPTERTTNVSVCMPVSLADELAAEKLRSGDSIAQIVRHAVRRELDERDTQARALGAPPT